MIERLRDRRGRTERHRQDRRREAGDTKTAEASQATLDWADDGGPPTMHVPAAELLDDDDPYIAELGATRDRRSVAARSARTTSSPTMRWLTSTGASSKTAGGRASAAGVESEHVCERDPRSARRSPRCALRARGSRGRLRPSVASATRASTNGVTAGPVIPARVASRSAVARASTMGLGRQGVGFGDGNGHEDTTLVAELPRRGRDGRGLGGGVDAVGERQPARPHPERRQLVCAEAEHRHAEHLEVLERAGEVEEGLGARGHRHDGVRGERAEVGADVARGLGASVHPADAAGGEDADAHLRSERQRRRDRRRAERPACATATGKSRAATLREPASRRSCSDGSSPTRGTLSTTAVTPGTAPDARTAARQRSRACAFAGLGKQRREDRGLEGHHGSALGDRGRRPRERGRSTSPPRLRRRARHRERGGGTRMPRSHRGCHRSAAASAEEAGRERVAGSGRVCCRRDRDRRDFGDRATTVDRDRTVATTVDDRERHALWGAI